MEYHVSKKGSDLNIGSIEAPFLTISKAASVADKSDTVIVHEGLYRECVTVKRGADYDRNRITFKAADGEKAIISGSEEIKNWEKVSGTVYKAVVQNGIFGEYNPYSDEIYGDWLVRPVEYKIHTGQVFINGNSLIESPVLEDLEENKWHAEVKENETEIYVNFGEFNPADNLVEINVRKACFVAGNIGIDYITVSGFEMRHAATQWSPPTAEQTGLLCANWCKGWIIENNDIHHSRCSGICLGKDRSTGHNYHTIHHKKTGHICQLETVFASVQRGWSKEIVGSHIVRNNTIHDCGQAGVVGHMGCAFSEVYGNHIYNILATEFVGWEVAGIKFHAAIDTYIHHNNIHNCSRGLWLDWQAQGARVSSNLFFNNDDAQDFFVEVTHGPHMIDNNIFGSTWSLENAAQGGAFVHNLFAGTERNRAVADRYTPYHYPHSTAVKGVVRIYIGDNRFLNNIFIGGDAERKGSICGEISYGNFQFNGCPSTVDEYVEQIIELNEFDLRDTVNSPVCINNNSYFAGSKPFEDEVNKSESDINPNIKFTEENGCFYMELELDEKMFALQTDIIKSFDLPVPLYSEAQFENADGTEIVIDKDFLGNVRSTTPTVGPIEDLKPGMNKILVWSK